MDPPGVPPAGPYAGLVLRYGRAGPSRHTRILDRLKERCLRRLTREHQRRSDKVLLVSGIRRHERRRRMGYVQSDGGRVTAAFLTAVAK